MADWQRTLDIRREWEQAKEAEIAPCQLAEVIAKKLGGLRDFPAPHEHLNEQRAELVETFADAATEGEDLTDEDVNNLMRELYDWADTPLDNRFGGKKCCWIKTF
jgi:hypothetical protein